MVSPAVRGAGTELVPLDPGRHMVVREAILPAESIGIGFVGSWGGSVVFSGKAVDLLEVLLP